jgi:hypothetical protein
MPQRGAQGVKMQAITVRRFLGFLFRPFLKIPPIRRAYFRRLLTFLEETPPSKLPEELRQAQTLLKRLPKAQRLAALEQGLEQGVEAQQPLPSRSLRRAAEREAKRRR